jgi:hypothetical protein
MNQLYGGIFGVTCMDCGMKVEPHMYHSCEKRPAELDALCAENKQLQAEINGLRMATAVPSYDELRSDNALLRKQLDEAIKTVRFAHKVLSDIPAPIEMTADIGAALAKLSAFLERMKKGE